MKLRISIAVALMLGPIPGVCKPSIQQQQTTFGLEGPRPDRPVEIPDAVLNLLKQDDHVSRCEPDAVVAKKWFTASAINLNGDKLTDLVVLPVEGCLFGANIGPIWLFRQTSQGYELALVVDALGIEVLKTRSHGSRDIAVYAATGIEGFTTILKFNGTTYQPVQRLCEAIGAVRFHCVFFLARRELEQRTEVPLMLPSELNLDYDLENSEGLHAIIEEASKDAYNVMLAATPDCNGAKRVPLWLGFRSQTQEGRANRGQEGPPGKGNHRLLRGG